MYNDQTMVAAKAHRDQLRFVSGFEVAKQNEEYAIDVSSDKGVAIMIPQGYDGTTAPFALQFPIPEKDRAGWDALNSDNKLLVHILTQDKHEWPGFVASFLAQVKEGVT